MDVYAAPHNGVSVWLTDDEGVTHHFHDDLTPYFFVAGSDYQLRKVCEWLAKSSYPVERNRAKRYEVFERREIVVLQVRLLQVNDYTRVVWRVSETFPALRYYHADLTIPQFYFFENNLFAFAHCQARVDREGRILEIESRDSIDALNYTLPPLRTMTLEMEGKEKIHKILRMAIARRL